MFPENQRFSGVFRGYKIGTFARNGLNHSVLRRFTDQRTSQLFAMQKV